MSICNYNTTFKEITSISQDLLLNILESNFKMFLDWAFLNIGAWFDASIPQSGFYGVNSHYKLLPVIDPSYDDGQVWQGIRKDWVWETGVIYNSGSPINISGVYIDNIFNSITSNTFFIDYPLGRIVLDDAIDTDSSVHANYSFRHIQVYRANDVPWFSLLQHASYKTDNKDILRSDDGDWSIGGNHRIQMPCIVIESVARSKSKPYEIGNNNLIIEQDLNFYILADNKNDRNKLLDILRLQQDLMIWLYDTNALSKDDNYPLDYNGNRKNNPLMYPNIIDQYKWRKCWIKAVNIYELDSPSPELHQGLVRLTTEIISH